MKMKSQVLEKLLGRLHASVRGWGQLLVYQGQTRAAIIGQMTADFSDGTQFIWAF